MAKMRLNLTIEDLNDARKHLKAKGASDLNSGSDPSYVKKLAAVKQALAKLKKLDPNSF